MAGMLLARTVAASHMPRTMAIGFWWRHSIDYADFCCANFSGKGNTDSHCMHWLHLTWSMLWSFLPLNASSQVPSPLLFPCSQVASPVLSKCGTWSEWGSDATWWCKRQHWSIICLRSTDRQKNTLSWGIASPGLAGRWAGIHIVWTM